MSFPSHKTYQHSRSQWLGHIPGHWTTKPLWTLFRRLKRVGFEEEQLLSVYRDYGVVPRASRNDNFNKPSDDLGLYQLVEPGDLAINKMKAWQGSVAISDFRGIVSPAYFVFKASHNEYPRYLHYLLRSAEYTAGYLSISKGIRPNQWDLEPQEHSRMPVLVPPLPEQVTIASFLDRETGKIDARVEEQKRLIELLKEKRQAVISHAVTKGLNPNARMKDSGVEWLGKMPEHWDVGPLKRYGRFEAGAGFPDVEQGIEGKEYPFFKVNAIGKALADGMLVPPDDTISTETAERLRAFVFPPNTIVFAKIGAALLLGRLRQLPVYACLDNNMMGYIVAGQNLPQYFVHALSLVRFDLISHPGTVPSLNKGQIESVALPIPPPAEQQSLVEYLDGHLARFHQLISSSEIAIDLLQERRAALISAAVTGKIDVRSLAEQQDAAE